MRAATESELAIRRLANESGHGDSLNFENSDRDSKGSILIGELVRFVESKTPFVYVRYGDGEFNSMIGSNRKNSDGHRYFPDSMGVELKRVLTEVRDWTSEGIIRIGGWWDDRHDAFVDSNNLRYTVPWCSPAIFYYEILSLRALWFMAAVRDFEGPKVLVGNEGIRAAAKTFNAEFVEIPALNCWLEYDRIKAECDSHLKNGSLFIHCAGMMSSVLGWDLWKQDQSTIQIDFGHTISACISKARRKYMMRRTDERRCIRKFYRPFFDQ